MRAHPILSPLLLALYASLGNGKTVSLEYGDIDAADLVGQWFNWQECYLTEESYNTSTLLEQDSELVPNGAIFLDYHDCGTVERFATIPVGTKLILLPIAGDGWVDVDDDVNSALTEDCPGRGTALDKLVKDDVDFWKDMNNYAKEPFATVNGETLEPFFVYSDKEFYYKACPVDPDKKYCDECDVNFQPEGCDAFAGTDHYPNYAWIAVDEDEWESGETRTYNFGFTATEDSPYEGYCSEATYTLTAAEKEEESSNNMSDPFAEKRETSDAFIVTRGNILFGIFLMLLSHLILL